MQMVTATMRELRERERAGSSSEAVRCHGELITTVPCGRLRSTASNWL